jgi:hypothetical protein
MQLHKRQKLQSQCAATLTELRRQYAVRGAAMRCDTHQRAPVIRLEGDTLANAQLTIQACCPEFAAQVRAALQPDR